MATIKVESEWMTHYLGSPLPKVTKLWCLDTLAGPLLFYIEDQSGRLFVHRATDDHHGQGSIDLSDLWQISGRVISVAVVQNKMGLIYAAFVERRTTASASDSVILMKAMDPSGFNDKEFWRNAAIRSSNKLDHTNALSTVNLGPAPDTTTFPETVIHYKSADGSHVAKVDVNAAQSSFKIVMYPLPITPDAGTDLFAAPAVLDTARGIFFCYTSKAQRILTFVSARKFNGLQVPPNIGVQPVVHSMQTMTNHDGFTDLLIGSDNGLYWYKSEDCIYSDAPSKLLVTGKITHVRGAAPSISGIRKIWMIKDDKQCGYVELDTAGVASEFVVVTSGSYHAVLSPTVSSTGALSRIVYYDDEGSLLMLEQSGVGIWGNKPLTLPVSDQIIEGSAHVTRIQITAEDLSQMQHIKLRLTCTSSATLLVNKKTRVVDATAGIEISPDAKGLIELVNPSEGLEAPHFFLEDAPDTKNRLITSKHPIDTTLNLRRNLAERSKLSSGDLQNIKNKDGNPLFDPNTDFAHLRTTLSKLDERIGALREDGLSTPVAAHPSHPEKHWSVFHWANQQTDNAKNFFMDAEHLVVTIGQDFWAFAVSCFEEALKAVHSVLRAAGAAWEDLMHWVGWVFNWEDIVKTQRSIQSLLLGVTTCTNDGIDALFGYLDDQLTQARHHFSGPVQPFADEITKGTNSQKALEVQQKATADNNQSKPVATSHPAIDYLLGKLEGFYVPTNDDISVDLQHPSIEPFWTTGFQEVLDRMKADLQTIRQDIATIFGRGRKLSIGECLAKLGKDSMILLIDCLREVLDKGIKPASKFFMKSLATAITGAVPIPFVSALYKHATGFNEDPSIVDLVAMLIAAPVTILGKICYGKDFSLPAIEPDTVKQVLQTASTVSTGNNVRRNLRSFYDALEQAILGPLANYQALICSVVDMVLLGFSVIDVEDSIARPTGWPRPGKAGCFFVALKFASTIFAIPIIDPEHYEITVLPSVRFIAYGIDILFGLTDIASYCLGADEFNTDMGFARAIIRLVLQAAFTLPEISKHYDKFNQETNDRKRNLAIWRSLELTFWMASDSAVCVAAELKAKDDIEDMQLALGIGITSGVLALDSQILRGIVAGKEDIPVG
jgi:hypothetical protein